MAEYQIHASLAQLVEVSRGRRCRLVDVTHDPRMPIAQAFDNGRKRSRHEYFAASDPNLSSGRIGEEFDLLHALPQVVEHRIAAPRQRPAIHGRLDALRVSIKEPDT